MKGDAVAVAGAGAIGGLLAASLRRAGRRVLILTRDARSARELRGPGFTVTDPRGRTRRFPRWTGAAPRLPAQTALAAVFLCVKAPALRAALRRLRGKVPRGVPVVCLLNGVGHGPSLRAAFGDRAVLGVCYIASTRTSPRALRHWGGNRIFLAETRRGAAAARAAAGLLRTAGWDVRLYPDEERMLWTKLVYNAAVNPLGALLRKTNGELAAQPALRELLGAVSSEACAVARAGGHAPAVPDLAQRVVEYCRQVPDQHSSMAQDMAAGRETEAKAILKPLLDAGRRTGTPTPLLTPLYRMVRRLEGELR